jgi:acyl-CoA synthetase (AMP-forming)/AMP-acid ligase II
MGVCWLPPYHDLGLIGGFLQVVFHGASCWVMSPIAMLQDPFRWLQAISRYRADTSGGPNFAYDFCVQRTTPEQRATLDLRRWSIAAIGSEPISPRTIEQFTATFEPCGFQPETFYPGYGLAESTLYVTGGAKAALPVIRGFSAAVLDEGRAVPAPPGEAAARVLVGCGHPWMGQEVRIVDPESRVGRPDGAVGEIWVRGPSVAAGYWNRPEETERTFRARLADGDGPYMRTGDLGFVEGDELFVTGRIKNVIVVRGRNHHPQDIEATVQSVHPGLRPGGGAAFEVARDDSRPRVVVVQEVDRRCRKLDVPQLVADIRQAVAERHDLQIHDVRLIEFGSIPKTTSGKVQHHLCRAGYVGGTLRPWKGAGA